MKYVGMHKQQVRNNAKSLLLLLLYPVIIFALLFACICAFVYIMADDSGQANLWETTNCIAADILPYAAGLLTLWFVVAFFANTYFIRKATGARPLKRRENPRVYNIVENLTIACGMTMPKVNIVDTPELNAYASGINDKTYTVTLTKGIIDALDDEELAGVVGHELTHIRNRDTRLLIIGIVIVGGLSTLMLAFREGLRLQYWRPVSSRKDKDGNNASIMFVMLVMFILSAIAYFFAILTRLAISRKREFMADAGGAELCGNPLALASALQKISSRPAFSDMSDKSTSQLFIYQPLNGKQSFFENIFSTHPKIEDRIAYLQQF